MLTDHLIRKAPSDFRQRFSPSPTTLQQKKVRFTMLTSTVDALTSSTTVALRGSFLAAPPKATSATSSTKKKKRHKEDAQAMKKKT